MYKGISLTCFVTSILYYVNPSLLVLAAFLEYYVTSLLHHLKAPIIYANSLLLSASHFDTLFTTSHVTHCLLLLLPGTLLH